MKNNIVKEAKAEVKKAKKENKEVKNTKTIIITVLITIAALATIAGILYGGFVLGRSYEASLNEQVQEKVSSLTAVVESSKK